MPLLTPSNILPAGMHMIAKCLARQGTVDKQRLKALLQPPTLRLRDNPNTFDVCLRGLRDLGIAVADGSTVAIAPGLEIPQDVRAFGEVLLHASCAGGAAIPDGAKAAHHDLLVSLTWWCAQDPYGGPVGWNEAGSIISHDLGPNYRSFPIGNDSPWQAFARWAIALGFAEYDGLRSRASSTSPVVPDMTRAVAAVLRVRRWDGPVPVTQAVVAIREALPMVDGGHLANALRPEWNLPATRRAEADALDLMLSHALLRGEENGALALENQSDAANVLLSDGPVARPVSHIALKDGGR